MNTNSKTTRKVVRVISASAFRRLNCNETRANKKAKVLHRMKKESDEE